MNRKWRELVGELHLSFQCNGSYADLLHNSASTQTDSNDLPSLFICFVVTTSTCSAGAYNKKLLTSCSLVLRSSRSIDTPIGVSMVGATVKSVQLQEDRACMTISTVGVGEGSNHGHFLLRKRCRNQRRSRWRGRTVEWTAPTSYFLLAAMIARNSRPAGSRG